MIIEKTGYGAGKRELKTIPNLLRIITGKAFIQQKDAITVIETCIDDMNPEVFGFLMDRLFENGALDVYWIPIFMKKNRPGTMVQVLCPEDCREIVIDCILSETTSLGVRYYDAKRRVLARESVLMETVYGEIAVKRIIAPNGSIRMAPEYEVCKKIALEKNIPIRIVYDTILQSLCNSI